MCGCNETPLHRVTVVYTITLLTVVMLCLRHVSTKPIETTRKTRHHYRTAEIMNWFLNLVYAVTLVYLLVTYLEKGNGISAKEIEKYFKKIKRCRNACYNKLITTDMLKLSWKCHKLDINQFMKSRPVYRIALSSVYVWYRRCKVSSGSNGNILRSINFTRNNNL